MLDDETDSTATEPAPTGDDVVVLGSESPDGKSVPVVRLREGQVEVGRVQPLQEGKPILGEVVKLTPRPETPRVCDVEVQYTPTPTAKARRSSSEAETPRALTGPPQVATEQYRTNWDAIWARRKKPSPAS